MDAMSPKTPSAHDVATVLWGVRSVVKGVLVLIGVVAFLILEFGTNVAASFHGTPKQVGFILVMMCVVPGVLLYFPLAWVATRWAKDALRRRGAQVPP